MTSSANNLRIGRRYGLTFGLLFAAWVGLEYLISGGRLLERYHISLLSALCFYIGGGLAVGGIVGLLLPLARHRFGAPLVGAIASVPLTLAVRVMRHGFEPWLYQDTLLVVIVSATLGASLGVAFRAIFSDETRSR